MAGNLLVGLALDPLTYAPIGVGCLVGAGVVTFLGVRKRSLRAGRSARINRATADWDAPEQSFSDRRGSVRREGPPVKVTVTSTALRGEEMGYVLDRSTGGLKVALTVAVPAGATVKVRAQNAPDTVPWVTALVRSCRNAGRHFELGCEFDETPPWNVLLLFG